METNEINSCLMLAVNLITPVDMAYIFDKADLKDTGIELDSHITLLYAQSKILPWKNIISDIKDILGDLEYDKFLENYCKNQVSHKVLDIFDLESFENDSDYIVLKLKKNFELFGTLSLINKGLRVQYDVQSDFNQYTPHVSLAELEKGMASKYLRDEKLLSVLEDTYINFEDLILSYGKSNEPGDRKQYFLTQFKCVDRFFRVKDLEKENIEILKEN